jgi:hypothetical protein
MFQVVNVEPIAPRLFLDRTRLIGQCRRILLRQCGDEAGGLPHTAAAPTARNRLFLAAAADQDVPGAPWSYLIS